MSKQTERLGSEIEKVASLEEVFLGCFQIRQQHVSDKHAAMKTMPDLIEHQGIHFNERRNQDEGSGQQRGQNCAKQREDSKRNVIIRPKWPVWAWNLPTSPEIDQSGLGIGQDCPQSGRMWPDFQIWLEIGQF